MEPNFHMKLMVSIMVVSFLPNVIVGDTLYVYYGGADRFCCVATCSLEELLSHLQKNKVK